MVSECPHSLTGDHQDLGLDMEGAGDHEEAPGVGVKSSGGRVDVPALAVTRLAIETYFRLRPFV